MPFRRTVFCTLAAWSVVVTSMHAWLNTRWFRSDSSVTPEGVKKLRVGFLPVTCHLTCPVTDFINKNSESGSFFEPVRFSGWPELKEAFLAGYTPATFILAPMAMKLREEGVPIKIVYLGHRDGSALMVHKESGIYQVSDLCGKKVAVPNRFSNQRLLVYRSLKQAGLTFDDIQLVEMPPPDMPAALYARAVDAISSGEPFMGQTELDGYGRILWLTKDVWPGFISCVLAVREDMIEHDRPTIQRLVDGIAKSGKWLDQTMDHRMQAAEFVSKNYYNQNPRLLTFVLSKPPDRVKYTNLSLRRPDFEEIEALGKASGILAGTARFEDYCDPSFVPDDSVVKPYEWEAPK
ncbi:MAG: ABC transporter substrate-binding protein [Phycisphaerales bacterium]